MKTFDEVAEEYAINMGIGSIKFMTFDFSYQDLKKISIIYARQACEAQRDLCMGGMGWKPEKVLQIPLVELK